MRSRLRGGVNLTDFNDASAAAARRPITWRRVAQAMRAGRMPPAGKPSRPSAADVSTLLIWCSDAICAVPRPRAHVAFLRRLNRAEYNNTLRELLGITFRPADDFPADDLGAGFDTLGDVLAVPPILLEEKYLDTAEQGDRGNGARAESVGAHRRSAGRHGAVQSAARSTAACENRPSPPSAAASPGARRRPIRSNKRLDRAARACAASVRGPRLYRRPLTHEELARFVRFLEANRADGDNHERGVRLALQAILTSPHFLFRVEIGGQGWLAHRFRTLATRLAYFLWSGPPDDEAVPGRVPGPVARTGTDAGRGKSAA